MRKTKLAPWTLEGDPRRPMYFEASAPQPFADRLPAGVYQVGRSMKGFFLTQREITTDGLIQIPTPEVTTLLNEFDVFWSNGAAFRDRGFVHKRGFILHGPPGSGKSSLIAQLLKRLVAERDGVALYINDLDYAGAALTLIRRLEPDRPILALMEDFEVLLDRSDEDEALALLDGQDQVGNIVFVATTNYLDKVSKRFTDRPSRFDTLLYIGMPSAPARRAYLEVKEPSLTGQELDDWVAATDGFSLAHLKEVVIAVKCLGQPLHEAVKRLDSMRVKPPKDAAPANANTEQEEAA